MKRTPGDVLTSTVQQDCGFAEHFLSCFPGKRKQQNVIRFYTKFNEIRNTINNGPGLSGSCTRDDKMRTIDRCDCIVLGRVQFLFVADREHPWMDKLQCIRRGRFKREFFQCRLSDLKTR